MFCFFKQKTADEMRISDWSSDVCSSDRAAQQVRAAEPLLLGHRDERRDGVAGVARLFGEEAVVEIELANRGGIGVGRPGAVEALLCGQAEQRGTARARMRQRQSGRAHV